MKIQTFNYIIHTLHNSWKSAGNEEPNDFTKLKLLKLHFFICSRSKRLLEVFDQFYALPLGPVESDILKEINLKIKGNPSELIVQVGPTSSSFEQYDPQKFKFEHSELSKEVDDQLIFLKSNFPELISKNAMELVEITHEWFAWKHYFSLAERQGKKSHPIPSRAIIDEPIKFYGQ